MACPWSPLQGQHDHVPQSDDLHRSYVESRHATKPHVAQPASWRVAAATEVPGWVRNNLPLAPCRCEHGCSGLRRPALSCPRPGATTVSHLLPRSPAWSTPHGPDAMGYEFETP